MAPALPIIKKNRQDRHRNVSVPITATVSRPAVILSNVDFQVDWEVLNIVALFLRIYSRSFHGYHLNFIVLFSYGTVLVKTTNQWHHVNNIIVVRIDKLVISYFPYLY